MSKIFWVGVGVCGGLYLAHRLGARSAQKGGDFERVSQVAKKADPYVDEGVKVGRRAATEALKIAKRLRK